MSGLDHQRLLEGVADDPRAERARGAFRALGLAPNLIVLRRTTTTQDIAGGLAARGAPAGTTVLAAYQETGRGRLDRTWSAPPDTALTLSVVLRPKGRAETLATIPMAAGLAALDALGTLTAPGALSTQAAPATPEGTGAPRPVAGLKWPNDVMVHVPGRGWRKAGGILIEKRGDPESVVLGIGINVHQSDDALPPGATSLTQAGWPLPGVEATDGGGTAQIVIEDLAAAFVAAILERMTRLEAGQTPVSEFRARLITLGRHVHVTHVSGELIVGVAVDVEPDGALVILDASGTRRTVYAGDVTLRPPPTEIASSA